MNVTSTVLPGVRLLEVSRFDDERGWFIETWNHDRYRDLGLAAPLVQTNASFSKRGVLRGMHFQFPRQQGKLITVLSGAIYDAVVDVRRGSPTFAAWFGCELSDENRLQLWAPEGFAHGFLVLSSTAVVSYGCTSRYDPRAERAVAWNDTEIGIDWPEAPSEVSAKDADAPRLSELALNSLPEYAG